MASEKKAPVLSEQEFRQVVAVARTHEHANRNVALLYFSVALGLRAKEMSLLKVQDVLALNGTIKDEVLLIRSTTKAGSNIFGCISYPAESTASQIIDALALWKTHEK